MKERETPNAYLSCCPALETEGHAELVLRHCVGLVDLVAQDEERHLAQLLRRQERLCGEWVFGNAGVSVNVCGLLACVRGCLRECACARGGVSMKEGTLLNSSDHRSASAEWLWGCRFASAGVNTNAMCMVRRCARGALVSKRMWV